MYSESQPRIAQARRTPELQLGKLLLRKRGSPIILPAKLIEISRPTLHDLLKNHGISIDK